MNNTVPSPFHITREAFADISLWGIVAGNLFSIFMALFQGWDLSEIMWIYWAQSIIIGLTNFLRILSLKEFSTENFEINERAVAPTQGIKIYTAFFFLFHFGFFHVVYAAFLWAEQPITLIETSELVVLTLCAMAFAGAHGFSLARNFHADFRDSKPNIGSLMFYPYIRIIPMHLTIIFGSIITGTEAGTALALIGFMALKTVADSGMHIAERRLFREKQKAR